jgi:hypothetical protein
MLALPLRLDYFSKWIAWEELQLRRGSAACGSKRSFFDLILAEGLIFSLNLMNTVFECIRVRKRGVCKSLISLHVELSSFNY